MYQPINTRQVFDLTTLERVHQKNEKEAGPVMALLEYAGHIVCASLYGSAGRPLP